MVVSVVLEEDESGSATCWFKDDDDDDDATIAWFKDFASWHAEEFLQLVPFVRLC